MDTPLHVVIDYATWWIAGWTVVNFLLPPREVFNGFPGFQRGYNVILLLVSYYGSLNIRQFTVGLYEKLGVSLEPNGLSEKTNPSKDV